jgi:uridylate kinase
MIKKRIILKLSGAALKDKKNDNILSTSKLLDLSKQIKTLSKTHQICIVVGGGNIWRGGSANLKLYREEKAHYMGMIATIINSMALHECLLKTGVDVETLSALSITSVLKTYSANLGNKILNSNKVLILAGGTGKPFFSTDTGAAKDALELHASTIVMAKDGVDGVYSSDPKINKTAKRFSHLIFKQAIAKNIKVMDLDALKICMKHNIEILVFNIERKNAIINAIDNKIPTTIITN